MENSFFGFDTSMPLDDDGGGRIAEPSEEEYDALNDETFGSAMNGDWEEVHENLVRRGGEPDGEGDALDSSGHVASGGGYGASMVALKNSRMQRRSDSDLELNLSGMKLDDVDISYGESENMSSLLGDSVKMDPSVWSLQPSREHHNQHEAGNMNMSGGRMAPNPADFLREHFHSPFHKHAHHPQHPQHQHAQFHMMGPSQPPHRHTPINTPHPSGMPFGLQHLSQMPQQQSGSPKICTLEDIERNIMMQQASTKQEQQQQQQKQQQDRSQQSMEAVAHQQRLLNEALKHTPKTPTPMQQQQQQQQHQQNLQQQHQQNQQQQHHQQQQQQILAQQQQQQLNQKLQQKVCFSSLDARLNYL